MKLKLEVIVFKKDADTYLFFFDSARRTEITRTFGRFAANPELNFSWTDAAELTQKLVATHHLATRTDVSR